MEPPGCAGLSTMMRASNTRTDGRDIGIVGYFGQGNLGDDLLASHAIETLIPEFSARRLIVSAPAGCYLEKWFPGIQCRPRGELIRDRHVDKVIFAGGGQFAAFPPARWTNLFGLRQSSSLAVLRDLWMRGRPQAHCFAYCVGVGPLAGWGGRRSTGALFTRFDHISVRDDTSRDLLRACDVSHARVVSDPVFATHVRRDLDPAPDRTLAIVVRGWSHATDIRPALDTLLRLSGQLRESGWEVVFISFQKRYRPEVIERLSSRGQRVVVWDPENHSLDAFVADLSRYKVMITLRAHALILRALMNLPCVSLRLEPKLEILAKVSGQERFVLDLNCSPETLLDTVLEAHSTSMNLDAVCQAARERVAGETATLVNWIRRHS
jgi:polysaccharide pyruvyl transferase WcaK-like protein